MADTLGSHWRGCWREHHACAVAKVEWLRTRLSPFENDPFTTVGQCFSELWPNTPSPRMQFVKELHVDDDSPWAETFFPDDDSEEITISIDVEASVCGAVELLAHELAHVAVYHLALGYEDPHGKYWKECYEALYQAYIAKVEAAERQKLCPQM